MNPSLPEGWIKTLFGTINEFKSQIINPADFPDQGKRKKKWSIKCYGLIAVASMSSM